MTAAVKLPRLHPSHGPTGSAFQTHDGKVYVRTPFGNRLLENPAGLAVYQKQRHSARTIVLLAKYRFLGALLGLVVGLIVGKWVL